MIQWSSVVSVRAFAILFLVVLTVSGCDKSASAPVSPATESDSPATESKKTTAQSKSKTPAPIEKSSSAPPAFLDGWKKPAVALLLSGEQHGYLEPCGCSETQSGGMARRADLVRILTEDKGWDVVGLDVGGTLKRARRQDEIKFDKLFEALHQMHYAAVGIGVEELKLGAEFILTRQIMPEQLADSVPLVSANVELFGLTDQTWPFPFRVIEKGGVRIGVTSIFGPSLTERVAPAGVNTNISVLDPDQVLPKVIQSLEDAKVDLKVLLCHGKEEEATRYAKAYPQFRVVLAAGGYDEPDGKPVKVGDSWILYCGHKGKRVGVLGYYPDNKAEPFKFELIQLDKDRFKSHPAMRELMRNYQQQLQDEGVAELEAYAIPQHPSGHTFVGAEKCEGCHSKAFAKWKETSHFGGFSTLKDGPWSEKRAHEREGWIPRQFDPECLSCHVTGWHPQEMLRYGSGYLNESKSPHLLGQQCENCHGPASLHVAKEESGASMDELLEGRKTVRRTLEEAKRSMCVECHDPDNSPTFTPERFAEFWKEVAHPFKD